MGWTREDVRFPSGRDECGAWLYRPAETERPPVVVLCHGLGGTRERRLDAYAERFAAAGIAALPFTYRNFGDSGGEPRQLLDIDMQLDDIAAALAYVRDRKDLITAKLAALQFYQLALVPPKPPAGSFDAAMAGRGQALFNGKAKCATCHVPPLYTEPGYNMHRGAELGIDDIQASRSPDVRYRTSPLRGLFSHETGGYYHDGRFATLAAVVDHYDANLPPPLGPLVLTATEKAELIEFLKSL